MEKIKAVKEKKQKHIDVFNVSYLKHVNFLVLALSDEEKPFSARENVDGDSI